MNWPKARTFCLFVWLGFACSSSGSSSGNDKDGGSGGAKGDGGAGDSGAGVGGAAEAGGATSSGGAMNAAGAPAGAAGEGGVGGAGSCVPPSVYADGQDYPAGIAVDAERVYWVNRDGGTVVSCSRCGCTADEPQILAQNQDAPRGIDVDSKYVYFTVQPGDFATFQTAHLLRCPLAGCGTKAPDILATANPNRMSDVEVEKTKLYVAAWPDLYACPLAGCDDPPPAVFGGGPVVGLAIAKDGVYIAFAPIEAEKVDLAGQNPQPLGIQAFGFALDTEHLYWSTYNEYADQNPAPSEAAIGRCPLAGCSDKTKESLVQTAAYGITVDDTHLFYTEPLDGKVRSVLK